MKFRYVLFFVVVMSISVVSCTKTTTQNIVTHDTTTIVTHDTLINRDTIVVTSQKNPIVGLWAGVLTAVNEPQAGPLYYSIDIRADSSLLTSGLGADGNTYYSDGTWKLNGTAFTATITSTTLANKGVVQLLTLTYDQKNGSLNGSWVNQALNASGTMSLNRIN
jgi:hypothetical protein